ncbi:MAG: GntR family transcriptional regulator [Pirellulales bacterium]|nr:GntR family transcriptional regulator [Pirellulales bacterium]
MSNFRFNTSDARDNDPIAGNETLSRRVYVALHDEILTGEMPPGTRLVRRALSKRLGVSPIPVAEALLRLEIDGLVESRPLCGSRVRKLTVEEMREDTVLREAIECQSARLCAENATKAQLTELMSEARQVDRLMSQGDPRSKLGMRAHLQFHLSFARSGGIKRLVLALEWVWFRRALRLNWVKAPHCQPVPDRWHQRVVEAVPGRHPDNARKVLREHVRYGGEGDATALEFVSRENSSNE